jgi:hypothetical protein
MMRRAHVAIASCAVLCITAVGYWGYQVRHRAQTVQRAESNRLQSQADQQKKAELNERFVSIQAINGSVIFAPPAKPFHMRIKEGRKVVPVGSHFLHGGRRYFFS